MLSVAIIGPDGAGKTTICQQINDTLSLPSKYVYMGVNLGSSNILLPTSRIIVGIRRLLGPTSQPSRSLSQTVNGTRKSMPKRFVAWVRSYLRLLNLLSEESFRHLLVWYYQRCGKVVLLDRWFFADYYAYEVKNPKAQPLSARIHCAMLQRVYPKPDLVIYLDAPASVLFARKGEGTVESLEQSQQKYLKLRDFCKNYFIVDANQTTDAVVSDVTSLILSFYAAKIRGGAATNGSCRQYEA
jgi:thymidylate kinase